MGGKTTGRETVGRKSFFVGAVVVALVVALTVGITVARSQEGASLPTLGPSELLAKVAQEAPKTTTVNGDVTWINDLLGSASVQLPGGEGGLASLLQSGSGRFWYQEGRLRFESQGSSGDIVAVVSGDSAWVYSSESGTATEYTLPTRPTGRADAEDGAIGDATAAIDLPQKIQNMVDMLVPDATLTVTTATVAGRAVYVLTMVPSATNTVVGSVQAAFDSTTFVPLRAQVFAKGDTKPVLEAGFTKVSYDEVSAATFDFTPPADAKVEHSTLTMSAGMLYKMMGAVGHEPDERSPAGDPGSDAARRDAELTLDEATARAGFTLAAPVAPALPFKSAAVIDASMMDALSVGATGDAPAPADVSGAPLVVLRYGQGFGTVVVFETRIDDAQWAQATAALAQVPLLGAPSAFGGHQAYQLGTRLGSLVAWRQGDVVVLVGGSVSQADLEAFASSIHE